MKKTIDNLLFLMIFIPTFLFGQSSLKGTVSEQESGIPLPGVNVVIKGSNTGTTTDFNGNYQIDVESGDVLVFSYVGFTTQEISFNGQLELNVMMSEDASALDEVVLIGYGSVKKLFLPMIWKILKKYAHAFKIRMTLFHSSCSLVFIL